MDLIGAVGPGADFDGALAAAASTRGAKAERRDGLDAETSAIPLLGMGPGFQDLLAQGRGRRADLSGVFRVALDRPAGVAPMAGRHVLGNGGQVLPVPACP